MKNKVVYRTRAGPGGWRISVGNYEDAAKIAKAQFVARMVKWMNRAEPPVMQKDIAKAIGTTAPTISGVIREPWTCSEHLIREISAAFAEMSGEYQRFRAAVDAPYMPVNDLDPAAVNGILTQIEVLENGLDSVKTKIARHHKHRKASK